jgi:3',5'-cyclic AMP phosphodiesterase CpdA
MLSNPTGRDSPFAVDLILVTGDVAERAEVDEYGPPLIFLNLLRKELKDAFSVFPEICVIPGNHNVNRTQCGGSHSRPEQEQFDAKFGAYNDFARQLDEGLCVTFYQPFVFKEVERGHNGQKIRLELVGFNSCIKESDREQDHYGYIGERQLDRLHGFLRRIQSTPYSIRVAAFHHNPLLQGQAIAEVVEALYRASPAGEARRLTLDLRNYLHDSRSVLAKLAEHGFHVALHGHQHIDDAFAIGFPGRYGEPFARSTVITLGAGSAGLRQGTGPQPSVASALLLSFEPVTWGWRLETRRIIIRVHGRIHPDVEVRAGDAETLILPRAQPLEAISAVARSLNNNLHKSLNITPRGEDTLLTDALDQELDRYVLWRATRRQTELQNLKPNQKKLIRSHQSLPLI